MRRRLQRQAVGGEEGGPAAPDVFQRGQPAQRSLGPVAVQFHLGQVERLVGDQALLPHLVRQRQRFRHDGGGAVEVARFHQKEAQAVQDVGDLQRHADLPADAQRLLVILDRLRIEAGIAAPEGQVGQHLRLAHAVAVFLIDGQRLVQQRAPAREIGRGDGKQLEAGRLPGAAAGGDGQVQGALAALHGLGVVPTA